jgi:hypothetical protein
MLHYCRGRMLVSAYASVLAVGLADLERRGSRQYSVL